jgi:hypothetical protein
MPSFDFRCKICQQQKEVFMKIAEFKAPVCCDFEMTQVLGSYSVVPDLEPYLDPHIGTEPVYVKSKQHRKELMKQYGVSEKFGKGWI